MKKDLIIGYAYIVGDILHFGHIQYLRNCKALCDKLIVGVLTDEAVMEKKPKPAIGFKERFELTSELKSVDAVVVQEKYSPKDNVLFLKPDMLFESTSHGSYGYNPYGKITVIPYFPLQSSSKIKEAIRGK